MNRIIYDFGANNGDDIPYYLKKGDIVVAVEANPILCEMIERRFPKELRSRRLVVENCVLNSETAAGNVDFYVHRGKHVHSQFPRPGKADVDNYEMISLPSRTPAEIIDEHGPPFYIKIDLEHYDQDILRHLFANGIRPPFISAEVHDPEVFCLLVTLGQYSAFKMLEGRTVSRVYRSSIVVDTHGTSELYTFPHHSAGPFGDDIAGEWWPTKEMFRLLAHSGFGWRDVHATNVVAANPNVVFRLWPFRTRTIKGNFLYNWSAVRDVARKWAVGGS